MVIPISFPPRPAPRKLVESKEPPVTVFRLLAVQSVYISWCVIVLVALATFVFRIIEERNEVKGGKTKEGIKGYSSFGFLYADNDKAAICTYRIKSLMSSFVKAFSGRLLTALLVPNFRFI